MPADDNPQQPHELDAIRTVSARLSTAFPDVPAAHVDETVQVAYHRFDRSRVRTFVPVLVEHAARDELTEEGRERASG
jgi:hypothetical protein